MQLCKTLCFNFSLDVVNSLVTASCDRGVKPGNSLLGGLLCLSKNCISCTQSSFLELSALLGRLPLSRMDLRVLLPPFLAAFKKFVRCR